MSSQPDRVSLSHLGANPDRIWTALWETTPGWHRLEYGTPNLLHRTMYTRVTAIVDRYRDQIPWIQWDIHIVLDDSHDCLIWPIRGRWHRCRDTSRDAQFGPYVRNWYRLDDTLAADRGLPPVPASWLQDYPAALSARLDSDWAQCLALGGEGRWL